ncbi:MAG TPA: cytochrome c-type biogenesis protein CcmH [Acidobacteriaceae bacterium]|nr:cytochrome c-type biogenesis protein CcmH [Acidobacteriaceae bacterium]
MHFATILLFGLVTAAPTNIQRDQIRKIEGKLMAPCCYTQTIDVHESEIARQMRGEVTAMVLSGKSEAQILDFYKSEYGESILAVPDGAAGTLVFAIPAYATVFAILALLCGMVITVRRNHQPISLEPPAEVEAARLHALRARIRDEWSREL